MIPMLLDIVLQRAKAMRKFQSQLLAAAVKTAACFDQVRVGKVSPTRIQIPGPQVMA